MGSSCVTGDGSVAESGILYLSTYMSYLSTWGTLFPRYGLLLTQLCDSVYQLYPSSSRCSYTALHLLAVQMLSLQNLRNE